MAKKRASIADADLFQTTEESQNVKTEKQQKHKTTLYITKETQHALDKAWVDLRYSTGLNLTKTDLIDAALTMAFGDGDYTEVLKHIDVNK